ncbi:uncharacterized protein LOC129719946 [Wyeomyia smithii]|uniref:uncharacterized protein LOC129719946 n=1 Tax=Wyeomyia smithii TaxID=174621 RepID=UPI002467BD87|nr:uncharacterized protein LOC129719946 [Wyeomyia smithii]
MARKRTGGVQKRVLKKAANKNASFVLESIAELKDTIPQQSPAKKRIQENVEKSFDIQPGLSDIPMFAITTPDIQQKTSLIEEIMHEWDSDELDLNTNGSVVKNGLSSHSIDLSEQENVQPGSRSEDVIVSLLPAKEVEKYKLLSENLKKEIDMLKEKNAKLEAQNEKFLECLTSKILPVPEKPFAEEEGFLDCETLTKLSFEAGDSDYTFVKFLMMKLWPEGFIGRSVTGRPSNNPSGRSKNVNSIRTGSGSLKEATDGVTERRSEREALEKVKVDFIINRLYERRIFLRDDVSTAKSVSNSGKRTMTRVIANASRKYFFFRFSVKLV